VHLFDFDREIYGSHVTVHLLHKLRDEARYDSFEALTAQIARDVQCTQDYFAGKQLG
jgi:riboflavin kinase/FMN adenylyltransferase